MHDGISLLTAWDSFYAMIGSSAAALTGLMFVVVTLVPEGRASTADDGISAFGTPTVVHFCAALLLSAVLTAPWTRWSQIAVAVGAVGLAGLVYGGIVVRRAKRQTAYVPVFEDWLWHTWLPCAAYLTLGLAAIVLPIAPGRSLFGIGGATVLLLFVGIHNAWDTVTYMALERLQSRGTPKP